MQALTIFISSPSDVKQERRRAALVIEELAKEGGIMAAMYLDGDKNLPKEILIPFVPTDKSNVDEIMKIANRMYGK